jgi:hypothetical protein
MRFCCLVYLASLDIGENIVAIVTPPARGKKVHFLKNPQKRKERFQMPSHRTFAHNRRDMRLQHWSYCMVTQEQNSCIKNQESLGVPRQTTVCVALSSCGSIVSTRGLATTTGGSFFLFAQRETRSLLTLDDFPILFRRHLLYFVLQRLTSLLLILSLSRSSLLFLFFQSIHHYGSH